MEMISSPSSFAVEGDPADGGGEDVTCNSVFIVFVDEEAENCDVAEHEARLMGTNAKHVHLISRDIKNKNRRDTALIPILRFFSTHDEVDSLNISSFGFLDLFLDLRLVFSSSSLNRNHSFCLNYLFPLFCNFLNL